MVQFDEQQQQKRLKELREGEEEALVALLAQDQYAIPYVDLASHSIDNDAIRLLTEEQARTFDVGPYKLIGKKLFLAVRSPGATGALKARELLEKNGFEITFVMASEKSIQKVWSHYQDLSFATQSRSGGLDIAPDVLKELSDRIKTTADAVTEIEQAMHEKDARQHISRLLEIILGAGIGLGASDVHIEPMESTVELRFRLDGVLRVITHFDAQTYKQINTRIKLLSGMKLTINSNPQDGRFSAYLTTSEISFRSSMIPGAYGESIVLRILNPKSIQVQLDALGISPPLFTLFMEAIQKPNGMILLTGPTGSGKTTTLYAFLQKIYSPEKKIITIEDPIEYHLSGITQTQTDHKKGYTFLEGLRSALRQDPDVIMVGEIRDPETAKIAVESALTGHMVFSTLHTNNAQGVIPRLIDLDINPKILVSALSLSIAQRLVRTLCPTCRESRPITTDERAHIDRIWDDALAEGKDLGLYGVSKDIQTLWSAKGCAECNNTGYRGRIGIFECIKTDAAIEKVITQNLSEREIKEVAEKQGLLDMKEDGLVKILQGLTDFKEVESVVDLLED